MTSISLKTRLFAGFILLLLLFSSLQIYSLMNLDRANQEFQIVNRFHLKVALQSFSLETSQNSLLLLLKNLTSTGQSKGRRPSLLKRWIRVTQEKRNDALRRLVKMINNKWQLLRAKDKAFMKKKVLPLLKKVGHSVKEMDLLFARLLKGQRTISKSDAKDISRKEHLIMTRVRRISSIIRNRVRRFAQQLEDNEEFILRQQILLLVAAVLLGIVVILLAARPLRSLKSLTEGARKLGSGDLSLRLPISSGDELGQLAKEFNTMAEAIEERESRLIQSERLAAAGRLAAQIAHEIRNPLAAISFNVELLAETTEDLDQGAPPVVEAKELLGTLQREVDRLTGITEEYLAFSRLPKPALKPTDLNDFLASVLDFIEGEMLLGEYQIETDLPTSIPPVSVDEDLLRQVLLNLVRNAKEAMPHGGTVWVRSRTEGERVLFSVQDSGPGMPDDVLGRLFEAFFTTKEHGTGLGMAVCQQIVSDHHGEITVETQTDPESGPTGTTVTVSLPLAQVSP